MNMIIATVSIFLITTAVWLLSRILPFRICPICAGVSGTWLWMLTGMLANQLPVTSFQLPVSILMGGSVVGIAYQTEKRLPPNRSPLLWKTLFIPTGFAVVYSLVTFLWAGFAVAAFFLVFIAATFLWAPKHHREESAAVKELEEKMKDCC